MNIALLVEDILERTGCSELQLAKRACISRSTLHRIRVGITKEPRHKTAVRLLALYFEAQQS